MGLRRIVGLLYGVVLACGACVPATGEQAPPPRPRAMEARGSDAPDDAYAVVEPPRRAKEARGDAPESRSPRSARRLLASLPVRERGPKRGYAREHYGTAWFDVDRNGCDTRNDILRRDLSDVRIEAGRRECVVEAGRLKDLYTGAEIVFERGRGSTLDIDHVVALGDAWVTGAAEWTPDRRLALANDPLNLLAVSASANRAKGDRDAGRWLPPYEGGQCAYVARQIAVKVKYGLWVTADERAAMARVLDGCPDALAPTGGAPIATTVAAVHGQGAAPAGGRGRAEPAPARPKAGATDPNYGTCKAAKARGAGPYYRDRDPEYAYYRDGDGDGIVCE